MKFKSEQLFRVNEELSGLRLDRYVFEVTKNSDHPISRSKAQELISKGFIRLNDSKSKPSLKVHTENSVLIKIPLPEDSSLKSYKFPIHILFEDDTCLVVHKPAGLVVHPAAGHSQDTLVNALLGKVSDLSIGFEEKRPGIVHRLDKDTSGLLVVAKTDTALYHLSQQFKEKTVHRLYHALVFGTPKTKQGTIRTHLERHPIHRKKFRSGDRGKMAITHYRWLKESHGVSLLECRLETGRTHQIRVHLSESQLPILGDPIYTHPRRLKKVDGSLGTEVKGMNGIGLHAFKLGFHHPKTGKYLEFSEDWPENLQPLVKKLGF